MPPERHSSPPPRPPRDRGPGFGGGGPRRSFGGGGFGGGPRDGGPSRPPFAPRPAFPPAEPAQSIRLREGDREVEIHGSAAFVRQTLEELPALMARLRGEAAPLSRPASISMPPPPRAEAPAAPAVEAHEDEEEDDEEEVPVAPAKAASHRRERHAADRPVTRGRSNGKLSLEDRVFVALEEADHPLSVAAIRKQVGGETTGQQIRRILERASDRVVATSERPAAYALR